MSNENVQEQTNLDAAAEAAEAVVESTENSLEAQLAAATADIEKARQDVLYAKAEAENNRRRSLEEVDKARKFAVEKFAIELLAVKDSLEMALADQTGEVEALKNGVELTLRQLTAAFEKSQLTEINPMGDKLDPHKHQAISMVPSDAEANTVVQVMQKGYELAGRVIRPAMVMVAAAK
ncbi:MULTISPECIES: nucleotide exchange factor GrpE [Iodobacter]|uniref:Protein GrpE n=2 Tax=Iodobacter TaxID=32014 RepID=A0A377STV7_9NEIS|nr:MULTISPECIES: nucleotide exchange factor GrpE [Iodobacter]NHQ86005.1 nucleotide exchange factor GrpE [Iodobacter violacea]TCU87961.1 molecular chaperone GrpE [Iodobacter fluviatilis]STR45462.1 HSP-70 cofactor [Iodobacter fluviatilis]